MTGEKIYLTGIEAQNAYLYDKRPSVRTYIVEDEISVHQLSALEVLCPDAMDESNMCPVVDYSRSIGNSYASDLSDILYTKHVRPVKSLGPDVRSREGSVEYEYNSGVVDGLDY
jgi:hypothetical protein